MVVLYGFILHRILPGLTAAMCSI